MIILRNSVTWSLYLTPLKHPKVFANFFINASIL